MDVFPSFMSDDCFNVCGVDGFSGPPLSMALPFLALLAPFLNQPPTAVRLLQPTVKQKAFLCTKTVTPQRDVMSC